MNCREFQLKMLKQNVGNVKKDLDLIKKYAATDIKWAKRKISHLRWVVIDIEREAAEIFKH